MGEQTSAPDRRRSNDRRGSSASDKQVAWAVKDALAVAFHVFPGEPPVFGWVMGMDDYHWVVCSPAASHGVGVEIVLVHRSCPEVRITSVGLDTVDDLTALEVRKRVDRFQQYIMQQHFGRDRSVPIAN